MKANLKEHCETKETLKYIQSIMREVPETQKLARKLDKVIRFYDEVETDLELGGESIVELDMERLPAIEERNKFLQFVNNEDDV